jgi:hypothetical protein
MLGHLFIATPQFFIDSLWIASAVENAEYQNALLFD